MRTALRKTTHYQIKKNSHPLKKLSNGQLTSTITTTVKKIKKHPYITLGTAALALSAISGLLALVKIRKDNQAKHFLFLGKR